MRLRRRKTASEREVRGEKCEDVGVDRCVYPLPNHFRYKKISPPQRAVLFLRPTDGKKRGCLIIVEYNHLGRFEVRPTIILKADAFWDVIIKHPGKDQVRLCPIGI
jgi:hypothetical protein